MGLLLPLSNPLPLPFSTSPSQLLLRILLKLLLPRLSLLLLTRLPPPLRRLLKGRGVMLTRKQPLLLSPLSFPTLMLAPTVLVLVFSEVFMLLPLVPLLLTLLMPPLLLLLSPLLSPLPSPLLLLPLPMLASPLPMLLPPLLLLLLLLLPLLPARLSSPLSS